MFEVDSEAEDFNMDKLRMDSVASDASFMTSAFE